MLVCSLIRIILTDLRNLKTIPWEIRPSGSMLGDNDCDVKGQNVRRSAQVLCLQDVLFLFAHAKFAIKTYLKGYF